MLGSDLGKAVVANAATQILLRQAPQAIDEITRTFDLSDGERQFLLSADRGQGLLSAGTQRVAFACRGLADGALPGDHESGRTAPPMRTTPRLRLPRARSRIPKRPIPLTTPMTPSPQRGRSRRLLNGPPSPLLRLARPVSHRGPSRLSRSSSERPSMSSHASVPLSFPDGPPTADPEPCNCARSASGTGRCPRGPAASRTGRPTTPARPPGCAGTSATPGTARTGGPRSKAKHQANFAFVLDDLPGWEERHDRRTRSCRNSAGLGQGPRRR